MAQIDERADNHKADDGLNLRQDLNAGTKIGVNEIRQRFLDIKTHVAHCKPKIIGVTKYYGAESIIKGYEAGIRDFGESRAIEAVAKIKSLPEEIVKGSTFHFIGHLQTNKVDKVVGNFDYIHSIDSFRLASIVSKELTQTGRRIKILLQLNNAGEEQKFGYSKEELLADLPMILNLENVDIVGLMNIAPLGADEQTLRYLFSDVRGFRDSLENRFNIKLPELSMGMSDDYIIAVQEGATMVRIGRKLFT